jgi:hypothetical protein
MTIKKGTHAPLRLPKLITNKQILAYNVTFTDSCRYSIGKDQDDINKLFGIGYFPHHHYRSVRVGWNYDDDFGTISLFSYWYKDWTRDLKYICSVDINEPIDILMDIGKDIHTIQVNNVRHHLLIPSHPVGFLLRPYFGGNQKAPHDITIKLTKF